MPQKALTITPRPGNWKTIRITIRRVSPLIQHNVSKQKG